MTNHRNLALAAAAAAFFAAGVAAPATVSAQAKVKCIGINACKGQSACATATNACKGLNACKGKGYVETATAAACTAQGGKVGS